MLYKLIVYIKLNYTNVILDVKNTVIKLTNNTSIINKQIIFAGFPEMTIIQFQRTKHGNYIYC